MDPDEKNGVVYINQRRSTSRGGDVVFRAGAGWSENPKEVPAVDGDFVFEFADGTEAMRLSHTGGAFVRGERVETEQSVYDGFRDWLSTAIVQREKT